MAVNHSRRPHALRPLLDTLLVRQPLADRVEVIEIAVVDEIEFIQSVLPLLRRDTFPRRGRMDTVIVIIEHIDWTKCIVFFGFNDIDCADCGHRMTTNRMDLGVPQGK